MLSMHLSVVIRKRCVMLVVDRGEADGGDMFVGSPDVFWRVLLLLLWKRLWIEPKALHCTASR